LAPSDQSFCVGKENGERAPLKSSGNARPMKASVVATIVWVSLSLSLLAGESKDYANVAEWKSKDTGYHTGDMVKYKSNIFRAAYWAGKEPGTDPGWSLYDELYDETSRNTTQSAKVIGYLPTWRKDLDYNNAAMYQASRTGSSPFSSSTRKILVSSIRHLPKQWPRWCSRWSRTLTDMGPTFPSPSAARPTTDS
jgi:hypothetical protein